MNVSPDSKIVALYRAGYVFETEGTFSKFYVYACTLIYMYQESLLQ